MLKRVISGAVLIAIITGMFYVGGPVMAIIVWLVSMIGYMELCNATGIAKCKKTKSEIAREQDEAKARGEDIPYLEPNREPEPLDFKSFFKQPSGLQILGLICITCYYVMIYFTDNLLLGMLPVVAFFLLNAGAYVVNFPKYRSEMIMANFFHFMYCPVMLSFMYLTRELEYGRYLVWLIIISSWGCDTCAYFTGVLLGRTKIFPHLSPKKTLQGCIGGVAGAGLLGALFGFLFLDKLFPDKNMIIIAAIICMAGSIFSMVGDLAASAIKRNHNLKDYGKLIPGHGGIMDRFDSVIVTAPMIYFLSALVIYAAQFLQQI